MFFCFFFACLCFALFWFCFALFLLSFFGIKIGLLFGIDDWLDKNISDIDGLGNTLPGGQQLADYRRLERAIINGHNSPSVEAGKILITHS